MNEDVRIRLSFSPRTPSTLTQRAQIRNLHYNPGMRVREERRRPRVRIQQGQIETPPAARSVAIAAAECHLIQGCGRVVCGFTRASARGNKVLCDAKVNTNSLGWGNGG